MAKANEFSITRLPLEIVKIEGNLSGSRVEMRSRSRIYHAIVDPRGEVVRLDVRRGRWWRVDRFNHGIPRRVREAVRGALSH